MAKEKGITQYFGANLAQILSDRIVAVFPDFKKESCFSAIQETCSNLWYVARVELHADELRRYLPDDFGMASNLLVSI